MCTCIGNKQSIITQLSSTQTLFIMLHVSVIIHNCRSTSVCGGGCFCEARNGKISCTTYHLGHLNANWFREDLNHNRSGDQEYQTSRVGQVHTGRFRDIHKESHYSLQLTDKVDEVISFCYSLVVRGFLT